jgi:hypothetical protein
MAQIREPVTLFEWIFANGDALCGGQVRFVAWLDRPSSRGEQFVNLGASLLFGSHLVMWNSHHNG